MKRALVLVMIFLLCFGVSACKKSEDLQGNNLPAGDGNEKNITLLYKLTQSEELGNIEKVKVEYEKSSEAVFITDKKDLVFLKAYTGGGVFPEERVQELYLYPSYCAFTVTVGGADKSFYLLADRTIGVINSNVADGEARCELYTSEKDNTLTVNRLSELMEKYS